jgi:iron complex outermembrane receptor protein
VKRILRIIAELLHEITMQKSFGKCFLIFALFLTTNPSEAQLRLRFITPEGFPATQLKVQAWTPFGVDIYLYRDSQTQEYLIYKDCKRIRATGQQYITLDTIFPSDIQPTGALTLIIQPDFKELEQAVISSSRSQGKLKESPVSISILKPYIIQNKIVTDISQSLDQVPGVNVADNQINIRNGNGWSYGAGSRVAVLLDDLPMLSPDAQSPQMSFIPLENVESVEIVKSAGSVLYGASAMNGVVNLRTKAPTDSAHGSIQAFAMRYGKAGLDNLNWAPRSRYVGGISGAFSQKINRTGLAITMNMLNNQGYRMNEYENRARIGITTNTQSKAIPGLEYGFNLLAQQGKSGSFLLWESYNQGYIPSDSGYNYSLSRKLNLDAKIEYKRGLWKHSLVARRLSLDNNIDNGDTSNQDNGSSLLHAEYRVQSWSRNNKLHATAGAVAAAGETHSPLFNGDHHSQNLAAFIQVQGRWRRLIATAGARLEHYTLDTFSIQKPVFRLAATYTAAKYTFIRASWGQGFRFPSMAESFIATRSGNVVIYPNPSLRPETGNNAEIGIKQGYRIGRFKAFADLSAFRTVFDNLMEFTFAQWGTWVDPNIGFGFKSVNTGRALIRGIEVETAGSGKIGKAYFQLLTGYTYTIPTYVNPDSSFTKDYYNMSLNYNNTRARQNNYLKYRYKHLFRLDLQLNYSKFEAGISIKYNSEMLNMDAAFIAIDTTINTAWSQLGSTLIFDVRAAYKLSQRFKINVQVLNLTNTVYFNRPADLRPPRTWQLQAVYTF